MWKTNRSEWLKRILLALALGLLSLRAGGQDDIPLEMRDDENLSREERIRRHNLRMQRLIAENQAREQAEAQQAQKTGTTVVRLMPTPAPAPTAPSPLPPAPAPSTQVAFRVSRAIVYFHPFQALSQVGESFATEIQVFNSSGGPFDEVVLHLKYDPLVMAPERVNDSPIYKLLDGPPQLRVNRSKGELRYAARLREEILKTTTTLLTIHWQALNPVFYSEIGFLSGDEGTRIGKGESNILGFVAGGRQEGGTLPGCVIIAARDDSPRKLLPPLGEIVIASINELVSLLLEADSESVAEGEEWEVSLRLRNNASVPFNQLNARILFDPAKLQVVDWHTGNWIRQGINIQDGFAHEDYPFDVFRANSADNERGEILYHAGTRAAHIFPSGIFAKIKFKALRDASLDDVRFDFEDPKRPGGEVETDVSFLGSTVMYAARRKVEADRRPAPEPLRRPNM